MRRFALVIVALVVLGPSRVLGATGRDIVMQGTKTGAPACSSCHGAHGEGQPGAAIPRLAGLNAAYLYQQLASFADGTRKNATMAPIAKALSDADRKSVTAYFSGLPPPKEATKSVAVTPQIAAGAALARNGDWSRGVPACSRCHGANGDGIGTNFPHLAGQGASYIEAQLTAFRDGTRHNDPMGLMSAIAKKLNKDEIAAAAAYYAALPNVPAGAAAKAAKTHASASPAGVFMPPPDSAIPNNEFGKAVRLGENIFADTQRYASQYVGDSLNCQSCHLDRGRKAGSAPLWAAYVSYPAYRSKNKHVNSYGERLQGCFRYSMNGKVPVLGSKTLVALEAYSYFLAKGAPVGDSKMKGRGYPALPKPAKPMSYVRGEHVYAQNCALCHGADGQGQASASGQPGFPPLWGPKSFNWGAGMGNIKHAAAFIKANMPFSQGGKLSDQEAWDVAMYVDSHDRPQDPRFTGNVQETRKKYHDSAMWMYGKTVNGAVLGAHSPPSGRR